MPKTVTEVLAPTPAALIEEWNKIKAHLTLENKRFGEFMAPYKARQEEIENQLHAFLNENKLDNVKTEHGTAYKSTLTQPKIVDRTTYLDWCLDNWDTGGNEMLQIGAPQVTAFSSYIEKQQASGDLNITPPGTEVSYFERINVRKT